ncbi:Hsp20/alpha crystallin family protein [Mesosutterella sp. OilRF-GAM-744-9]|uniref:Hsp20/alpha crystallin family protein n=2 Tax=Mesosutterella TaxID=2494213 RepID=A0ABS9MN78_9BURK|nr:MULTISPECIES: Hsp20/alpha crystallin family protein [unclassified Mesosutterella]MCG5030072.1 Hsp20/alpha crystallin family protein [Mesosutterella sp. oilRF-744-WT-GAM-9]MCI6531220.1 Hsp20/alpha crystallin family protein [Mesosutterella sp.]MDL2060019.1 Hsp20/alpha crystallin family protein [Mesosutterella sp. AGMB02718]
MASVPTIFEDSPFGAFDPFDVFSGVRFPDPAESVFGKHADRVMKTDVRETDKGYTLMMDLPGFKKDEISAELKDGYLTISAQKDKSREEKMEGRLIRSERSTGACSRTFYVGEGVKQEDCSASFEDGILTINVPKASALQPQTQKIAIQ